MIYIHVLKVAVAVAGGTASLMDTIAHGH